MRTTRHANDGSQAGERVTQDAAAWSKCRYLRSSIHLVFVAVGCASALVIAAGPAAAHGPCGCITPTAAAPGEQLVSNYPTIKIVWNPLPADLLIGPEYLTRDHVTGQPRLVLQEQPRPGTATFRVPATAPGRYLVLLYDGTEGGAHYSWDYITVRSGPRSPSSARPTVAATGPARPAGGLDAPVLVGLAAALVALLGAGVLVLARKHRTHSGSRTGRAGTGGQ
jgi:hypothetical protein